MTAMTPGHPLEPAGRPRPTAGGWRVDPGRSQASFGARAVGRTVRGRLPLTGRVLITEPIEDSAVRLAATASAVSTGSPWLDRLLAGPSFLDAGAFPEISYRSELLAWVRARWRAVGYLQVKGTEHELACRFDLHLDDSRPGGRPRLLVTGSWIIDARWITRQRIPAAGRHIVMTCCLSLEPNARNLRRVRWLLSGLSGLVSAGAGGAGWCGDGGGVAGVL